MTAPTQTWLLGSDRQWHALGGRVIGPPPPAAVAQLLGVSSVNFGSVIDPPTGYQTPAQWLASFPLNPNGMKPSTANTGVPTGTTLTNIVPTDYGTLVTGQNDSIANILQITANNVTIENKYIPYYLRIRGNNCTIRNCEIVGGTQWPDGRSESALVDHRYLTQVGLQVIDCTLHPQVPNYYINSWIGHHATFLRCESYHTVDFGGIYNNNNGTQPLTGAPYKDDGDVKVYGCYIHDFAYFYPDPAHTDGTHNDGIQFHGGRRSEIIGNNFQWFAAPASQFNASSQALAVQGANAFVAQQGGVDATATANRGYGSGIYLNKIVSDITLNTIKWNWFRGCSAQLVPRVCYGNTIAENRLDYSGKLYTSGSRGSGTGSGSIYVIRTDTSSITNNTGIYTNVFDATGVQVALDPSNPSGGRLGVRVDS